MLAGLALEETHPLRANHVIHMSAPLRDLWQQARWECRKRGTSLMAFFDSRCPMARVIQNLYPDLNR